MSGNAVTEAVWSHLSTDLRRFIRRRVSDDHLAEDLLQETFLRIHRGIATLRDADRVAPWVYRIAQNVLRDHYRKPSPSTVSLEAIEAGGVSEGPLNDAGCRSAGWLDQIVRSLPVGYQEAVRLAEIEGLPQQEVADRLGISLTAAKSRIQRGRAMLKGSLDECCRFEVDARGSVIDCEPRPDRKICRDCGD